jgi:AraC family transcriptional regulator
LLITAPTGMDRTPDLEHASAWRPAAGVVDHGADVGLGYGATARRFRHGSYRLESPWGCADHLVALRLSGSCRAERVVEGRRDRGRTEPGRITIQPAASPSSWSVEGDGELLYVFLPSPLLETVAEEQDLPPASAVPAARFGVEDAALARLLTAISQEVGRGSACTTMRAEALVLHLASELLDRHHGGGHPIIRARVVHPFSALLRRRIDDYLEARLADGVSIADLAAFAGISRSHFIHRFRMSFGTTPHRYLVSLRIERAKALLMSGLSPLEVACLTGFADQSHLTSVFRRWTGSTPAAFRREHRRRA